MDAIRALSVKEKGKYMEKPVRAVFHLLRCWMSSKRGRKEGRRRRRRRWREKKRGRRQDKEKILREEREVSPSSVSASSVQADASEAWRESHLIPSLERLLCFSCPPRFVFSLALKARETRGETRGESEKKRIEAKNVSENSFSNSVSLVSCRQSPCVSRFAASFFSKDTRLHLITNSYVRPNFLRQIKFFMFLFLPVNETLKINENRLIKSSHASYCYCRLWCLLRLVLLQPTSSWCWSWSSACPTPSFSVNAWSWSNERNGKRTDDSQRRTQMSRHEFCFPFYSQQGSGLRHEVISREKSLSFQRQSCLMSSSTSSFITCQITMSDFHLWCVLINCLFSILLLFSRSFKLSSLMERKETGRECLSQSWSFWSCVLSSESPFTTLIPKSVSNIVISCLPSLTPCLELLSFIHPFCGLLMTTHPRHYLLLFIFPSTQTTTKYRSMFSIK